MKETDFSVGEEFWVKATKIGLADFLVSKDIAHFLKENGDYFVGYSQDRIFRKTGFILNRLIVASAVVFAFSGFDKVSGIADVAALDNKIDEGLISDCETLTIPAPNLSPIEQYAQAMEEDRKAQVEEFTAFAVANGSPDYSGLGYSSCSGDYDCLVGEETCKAGIVPSSNSMMPGYCVPNQ